jgi:hypothetical protein
MLLGGPAGNGRAAAAVEHDRDDDGGLYNDSRMVFDAVIAPGSDRYLLMGVTATGTVATVTTATLGPLPLGFIGAASAPGAGCHLEWWGLSDPPVGTQQVVVELASSTQHAGATAISYRGVDRRNPLGMFVSGGGLVGPTSVTIASTPGGVVVDNVCGWAPDSVIDMAGDGQTARWHWLVSQLSSAGSQKDGAPSVQMTWTASASGMMPWAAGGIALNPAAPGSSDGGAQIPVPLRISSASCHLAGRRPAPGAGGWLVVLVLLGATASRCRARRELIRGPGVQQ